jgi:RNA polymerase sigma factor (TIGR02999 family)
VGAEEVRTNITRLIEELRAGDEAVVDELFALLYAELRALAHRHRRHWRGDHTLGTTVLVHEAYVKLAGQAQLDVESRAHFLALAARAMRHVLCNYSRDQQALKRGGGLERVPIDDAMAAAPEAGASLSHAETLATLDDALHRLEKIDPRQSRVVECRFFGGLTIEETAIAVGVSPRTVRRDWTMAQAWLHREMTVPS